LGAGIRSKILLFFGGLIDPAAGLGDDSAGSQDVHSDSSGLGLHAPMTNEGPGPGLEIVRPCGNKSTWSLARAGGKASKHRSDDNASHVQSPSLKIEVLAHKTVPPLTPRSWSQFHAIFQNLTVSIRNLHAMPTPNWHGPLLDQVR